MPAVAGQQLREHGNQAFKARSLAREAVQLRSRRVAVRAGADARARLQDGRYEEALRLYDSALKELPNDAGLLCNCAATRLRVGDHRQARRNRAAQRVTDGRAAPGVLRCVLHRLAR